jgi:hypothetical protein
MISGSAQNVQREIHGFAINRNRKKYKSQSFKICNIPQIYTDKVTGELCAINASNKKTK